MVLSKIQVSDPGHLDRFVIYISELMDTYLVTMQDAENYLSFLHSLSDMGAAMRKVMTFALTNEELYAKLMMGKIPV